MGELEEVVDEPLSTTDTESQDYQTEETVNTHNIIKKKIIKKNLIVDGKPVEVEDFFESPITADSEPQASEKMKEKNKKFKGATHEIKKENDKQNLASFNLPISDHANDFMEVIEGGGFSLDDEDEEIANEIPTKSKEAGTEKSGTEKSGKVSVKLLNVEDLNALNKEIPSVKSSVVQSVLAEGSVSIIEQKEIVGESNGVTITVAGNAGQKKFKDNKEKFSGSDEKKNDYVVKPKPTSFNLPMPEHANDWMEVIEGGGFSLDDEDEHNYEEIPKEKGVDMKNYVQKESKSVINHKDLTFQAEDIPSVTTSVVQAVLDDDLTIEQKVITEGSVSVIQQRVVEPKPSFNLPISDHANNWMEVIETGGFSLEEEDEVVPEVTSSVVESVLKNEEKIEIPDKSQPKKKKKKKKKKK